MKLKYRWTVPLTLLLVCAMFMAGCVNTPGCCPPLNVTSCSNDSDCVPAGCCHPTGCINTAYRETCTATACSGNVALIGAGHCGCVNSTGVIPTVTMTFFGSERAPFA
jgi:hypothetical protein